MAKGLKMYRAKDKYSGAIIKIKDITPNNHGDLICEDCGVDIKYTSAYKTKASNNEVAAYLSLKPNREHKESCNYNVVSAIKKIVDFSQSVEEGTPVITKEADGSNIYRLNFLEKALYQIHPSSEKELPNKDNEEPSNKSKIGTDYILSNKQIASYFRSAAGVTKIKSLLENKEDKQNFDKTIKINYKKQNISWNDFYFEQMNYDRLYNNKYEYPLAIKIFIKDNKIFENEKENIFKWSVKCIGLRKINKDKPMIYSIFIKFNDIALANKIISNTEYIILGKVFYNKMVKDKTREIYYKSMNVNIFNEMQIQNINL